MDPPDSPISSAQTINKNFLGYKLFDKMRSAYVQKEMANFTNTNVEEKISENDLNKIFVNEMERVLNQDPYGRHTKMKFKSISKSDEVYLRFSEVIMFYMWSPLDAITETAIKTEVSGMNRMSNLAKVEDVRKFIVNNFGSIIHEWAKIEKINPKLVEYIQIDDICNLCLEKNGLPVIPDKTNDSHSYLDLRMILEKAKSFINQLDEFERGDSDINKNLSRKVRELLERFHKMYLSFLNNIPLYNELLRGVYEKEIETGFNKSNFEDELFDDFAETKKKSFGTIWRLLFNAQKVIKNKIRYKDLVDIYPDLGFHKIKFIIDRLNWSAHSEDFEYDVILFKEKTELFIESLKDLMLVPSTVVFYRMEKDAFGIHYKGNTLDGNVFVMLSQEGKEYELGKFYLVTSITNPAYLVGYAVPV